MPTNLAFTPPRAATGIKNLNVLPLSPQSSRAVLFSKSSVPSTVKTPSFIDVTAPNASIQPIVALMSFDRATGEIVHFPRDNAAHIIAR